MLFFVAFAMTACSNKLTEKVEAQYESGKPQRVSFYDRHGSCVKETEYYENGQVKMEGEILDGKREGAWTAYFEDGRVQSKGIFHEGLRTGAATVYQPNGNLYMEGEYKDGKHCGKWKFYDEQGNLLREDDYGEGVEAQ